MIDALGPSELEYSFIGGLGSRIYHSNLQLISGTVPPREGEINSMSIFFSSNFKPSELQERFPYL